MTTSSETTQPVSAEPARRKSIFASLWVQVFIAMVLAVALDTSRPPTPLP